MLALDDRATTDELARAISEVAGGDRDTLERAARRVRLDVLDEPRSTAAARALTAIAAALASCAEPAALSQARPAV